MIGKIVTPELSLVQRIDQRCLEAKAQKAPKGKQNAVLFCPFAMSDKNVWKVIVVDESSKGESL